MVPIITVRFGLQQFTSVRNANSLVRQVILNVSYSLVRFNFHPKPTMPTPHKLVRFGICRCKKEQNGFKILSNPYKLAD